MNIKEFRKILNELYKKWNTDRGSELSAALSFYSIFSLVPILIIIISVTGFVVDESIVKQTLRSQAGFLDTNVLDWLDKMIENWSGASSFVSLPIGILLVIFGAARLFTQLQNSLNIIFECSSRKGFKGIVVKRLISFAMLLIIGIVLLASIITSSAIASIHEDIGTKGTNAAQFIEIFTSLVLITILFGLIFKFLPDHRLPLKDIWVGAFTSAALFSFGKITLSYYLTKSNILTTFGAAGFVVVLTIWVYYTSIILFAGAEVTYLYSKRHGSPRKINSSKNF